MRIAYRGAALSLVLELAVVLRGNFPRFRPAVREPTRQNERFSWVQCPSRQEVLDPQGGRWYWPGFQGSGAVLGRHGQCRTKTPSEAIPEFGLKVVVPDGDLRKRTFAAGWLAATFGSQAYTVATTASTSSRTLSGP